MRLPSVLFALLLVSCCHPIANAQEPPNPKNIKITLDIRDLSLVSALEAFFTKAGVKYRIEPGVEQSSRDEKLSISFTNVPFQSALDSIIRSASWSVSYRVDKGVYVIRHIRGAPPVNSNRTAKNLQVPSGDPREGHIDRKITIKLVNMELPDALRTLLDHVGASYGFPRVQAPGGKIKTIEAVDAPFETVLGRLLSQAKTLAPLEFDVHDGIYMIGRGFGPPPPPFSDGPAEGPLKIDLRAKNADLRYMIKALFRTVGANYSLDQNVIGRVTIDIRNSDVTTALHLLLKAAKATSSYAVDFVDSVYRIKMTAPGGT